MSDDDPFADLDVTDDPTADLDRATRWLTVRTEERRYGKSMVLVEGFESGDDLQALASDLKSALGTGGTVTEGTHRTPGRPRDAGRGVARREGVHRRPVIGRRLARYVRSGRRAPAAPIVPTAPSREVPARALATTRARSGGNAVGGIDSRI